MKIEQYEALKVIIHKINTGKQMNNLKLTLLPIKVK